MAASEERQVHHHGETIRAFRVQRGLTQAQLAERWPGDAVNPQYVQRVETGKKRIADQQTLRRLGELLDIPLWRFGLSEYDPFHPHNLPGAGVRIYVETLDALEALIQTAWLLRCAALLPQSVQCMHRVNALMAHFKRELSPPAQIERRYLRVTAQAQRLNAVAAVERGAYTEARARYATMLATARELGEPALLALALMSAGSEQLRASGGDRARAVDWLEQARDVSFSASKQVAALVQTYLARAYAELGDRSRFERAAETASTLAAGLGTAYGDGTDGVFARESSVLAEWSWGWLELGEPRKTLALRETLDARIARDGDRRLAAWIRLDWARALLALGELEASIAEARAFCDGAAAMHSPHALRSMAGYLRELAASGGTTAAHELRELRELAAHAVKGAAGE